MLQRTPVTNNQLASQKAVEVVILYQPHDFYIFLKVKILANAAIGLKISSMYSEPEFRNMKRYLLLLAIALFGIKAFAQTSYRNEWIDYSKTYYKFKLHLGTGTDGYPIKSGLVRINQPALAAAGLANVPAENLQLWKDGHQ